MIGPFYQIPGEYAVPGSYTEIQDVPSQDSLGGMPLRAVIIGQVSGGSAVPGTVYANVTGGAAQGLFGAGTVLAQAAAAFSTERPEIALDVVGVAPVQNGVAASATVTFTGTATAAGTAALWIGGYRYSFPVQAGQQAADAAAALVSALSVPVAGQGRTVLQAQTGLTVAVQGAVVTLRRGETGDCTGNAPALALTGRIADSVPGIAMALTPFTGGAGTPDLTPALQALGTTWYTDIVLTLNDPTSVQSAVLEARRRCGALIAQDARVWVSVQGTQGQILALAGQFTTAEELVLIGVQSPRWSPWVAAAVCAAQGAQSLNQDPARQLQGIVLNGLSGLGPSAQDQFSASQRNVMLNAGCATLGFAADGTVTFERVVTARQVDPQTGVATGIWDVMVPAIGARVRYEWNAWVTTHYFNAKLADDGSPLAGQPGVVTCRTLQGSWVAQCKLYELQGWIDGVATVGPQAVFQRHPTDRSRVDAVLPIRPMGSLIVLANILQLQV